MTFPGMELAAQVAVGHVLNSLPEGLLVAVCAWGLLRVMGRQNAGTRFAVWMMALVGIALLPWLDGLAASHASTGNGAWLGVAIPGAWAVAFFLFWMVAAAGFVVRIAAGVWQVHRIRRGCVEIPLEELSPALAAIVRSSRRRVRILASTEAQVPAAIGLGRAAVVLPAWALDELSEEDLRAILVHELTHLERRDDWTNLLQKAVRAVLFFHPAVWWIESRLSIEREMACDDAVVAATGNPRAYAGCLIGLLERGCARRGWSVAQAAVARARDAAQRIAQILSPGRPASVRMGRTAPVMAAGLSAACLGMALVAPQLVVIGPEQPRAVAAAAPLAPAVPRAVLGAENDPAVARVVPADFAVKRTLKRESHHTASHVRKAAAVPAVMRDEQLASPQVQLASLGHRPVQPRVAAAQWTVMTTMVYSRAASTESHASPQPLVVQTVTWRTIELGSHGAAVRTLETLQVVWMTPAQVVAEEAASSRSI